MNERELKKEGTMTLDELIQTLNETRDKEGGNKQVVDVWWSGSWGRKERVIINDDVEITVVDE